MPLMLHGLARTYVIATALLVFLCVAAGGFLYLTRLKAPPRSGSEHIFELSERPKFLTEELALTYARATLKADGLNPADWRPVTNGRTRAPDGRVDAYMARTAGTSGRGVILFAREGRAMKFVAIELRGSRVVCQSSPGR
jgi:hypothetical protein